MDNELIYNSIVSLQCRYRCKKAVRKLRSLRLEYIKDQSKNINDFLYNITNSTQFTTTQIYENLKDSLSGKTANIYSCGPSFSEFKDKIPIDEDTIKICIKGTYNLIENPDILIFDNRVKTGHRVNDVYNITDKTFKIYMGDYFYTDFFKYIRSLPPVYNYPVNNEVFNSANLYFTPNSTFSSYEQRIDKLNNDKMSLVSHIDNNLSIIYGNYNIYFPLVYRLLLLFDYMGVKKFNITGVDGFNPDFSQNHYFEKNSIQKFLGYDTIATTFFDYSLDYSKFDITLYSDKSNANIQIPRYKEMDLSYHFSNKLKTTALTLPDTITNTNHILLLQMIHCLAINGVRCNIDIISTPVDKIIEILEQKNLEITFENIINYIHEKKK